MINFDASCSSDPDSNSLTYRWDFENDGVWDTEWSDSPTASYIWNDDWTGTVKVQVSDGALTDDATATVTISNAAPTVDIGPDIVAISGSEVSFSGSFTDAGAVDSHVTMWDFGDGETATGTLTPTHTYSEAKKYTVTLTITDDDDGVGTDTLIVNTGVNVSISPSVISVQPGGSATFNAVVQNLRNNVDSFDLKLYSQIERWCSLSTTSVTLNSGQSVSVTLTISPPSTATIKSYRVTILAESQTNPAVSDTANADSIIFTELATIESCNSTGTGKNIFDLGEQICVTGTGYSLSTTYDIYVVNDVATWVNGMTIPQRVTETATSVTSDINGNIPATPICTGQLSPGKYDIIVDVNGNGLYDEGIDALDNNDTEVTAGLNVIPEFGAIAMLIALIMLTSCTVIIKRSKR